MGADWWRHLPRRAQSQQFGFDLCVSEALWTRLPLCPQRSQCAQFLGAPLRELTPNSPPQGRGRSSAPHSTALTVNPIQYLLNISLPPFCDPPPPKPGPSVSARLTLKWVLSPKGLILLLGSSLVSITWYASMRARVKGWFILHTTVRKGLLWGRKVPRGRQNRDQSPTVGTPLRAGAR